MNEERKTSRILRMWIRIKRIAPIALAFLFGYSIHSCSPQHEIYVDEASWMPEGASDGIMSMGATFIFGPPMYFYEYDISEQGFIDYLQDKDKNIKEITAPAYVRRYLFYHVRGDEFRHLNNSDEEWKAYQEMTYAKIVNGVISREQFEDQEYTYAYDRDRGRAFVYIQTR